jgi:hypothetical protein
MQQGRAMTHAWAIRVGLLLAILATFFTAIAAFAFAPVLEHARRESPDGAFVAVAYTQPFYAIVPVMPGGSGDKPGRVTVFRNEQSCGSAWIEMVSFIYDLRWLLDTRPRRAEIPLAATWNLDACSVEISSR